MADSTSAAMPSLHELDPDGAIFGDSSSSDDEQELQRLDQRAAAVAAGTD
jgi:hypothetical protein